MNSRQKRAVSSDFLFMVTRTLALIFLWAILYLILAHLPASAHAAKSGWVYPEGCCSQPSEECHEVPASTLKGTRVNQYGQRVLVMTFEPGDHPNVKAKITFERMPGWFKQSGDSEHHACISPQGTALYCYFWQAGG